MIEFLKRLLIPKRVVQLKIEIEEGKYHEEIVESDQLEERLKEIQSFYFPKKDPKQVEFIWCLVGNVIEEHYFGEQKEIRRGTKHFSPGTKLYCFPAKWGDGYEKIIVIGRSRKTNRFVTVILPARFIGNWRLQKVYDPFVKKRMLENRGWDDSAKSKTTIENMLKWLPEVTEKVKKE